MRTICLRSRVSSLLNVDFSDLKRRSATPSSRSISGGSSALGRRFCSRRRCCSIRSLFSESGRMRSMVPVSMRRTTAGSRQRSMHWRSGMSHRSTREPFRPRCAVQRRRFLKKGCFPMGSSDSFWKPFISLFVRGETAIPTSSFPIRPFSTKRNWRCSFCRCSTAWRRFTESKITFCYDTASTFRRVSWIFILPSKRSAPVKNITGS